MKRIILTTILFTSLTISHSQDIEFLNYHCYESLPSWIIGKINSLNLTTQLLVDNSINPFYLEADFNGDMYFDIALCVKEKSTQKKGILIIHGNSYKTFLIGAGVTFAHLGDNFRFIEVWKVYREKEVWLTIFSENGDIEGNESLKIDIPAIEVASSEGAPNIIIWENDKYIWLHTGD